FRYVFVGGFASERMTGYFSQCEKELRAFGVPSDAIDSIFPSSHELYEGNSDEVRARFLEIAAKGPEPLVVIAHSRGACDALAFAAAGPVGGPDASSVGSGASRAGRGLCLRVRAASVRFSGGRAAGVWPLLDRPGRGRRIRLCILVAGHTDLTHRFPATRAPR